LWAKLFSGKAKLDKTATALRQLADLLCSERIAKQLQLAERLDETASQSSVWTEFLARPADFFAYLTPLGVQEADSAAASGQLPEHIVEAVRRQSLDQSLLEVNLRGYQSFGARYALVQRRVLLGDEMGLGKTIQALAAFAHLAADEAQGFVVVCPATVVANWASEIRRKSRLVPIIIHGSKSGRRRAFRRWVSDGGVGIMSYETARSLHQDEKVGFDSLELSLAVVDEAHYVKNSAAGRSLAVAAIVECAQRVLFLSGTPMENRLAEFYALIEYLQPERALAIRASAVISPAAFRTQVAPVYLRRNQEDVLSELPERIQSDEWLTIGDDEREAYEREVRAGNFMGMRRAVIIGNACGRSAKLDRLGEILDEAGADGCKVLVFSFFRAVIDSVCVRVPGAFGPIHGSVPPLQRQSIIDSFSAAAPPAVLVAQIQSVAGLNIQPASVVVLMEPQIKPSLEEQAIARAHRMGQTHRVQVFRLLASGTVDERMVELLAIKSQEFDDYARESSMKEASPEAMDVSDTALASKVIRLEQERLAKSPVLEPEARSAEQD
jgi:SNF2 family DNA or RNA helicase